MSGNLLIFGNGFDLKCNLKSKFSDFYASFFPNGKIILNSQIENNIWYLLFFFHFYLPENETKKTIEKDLIFKSFNYTDPLWMNVEFFVKYVLTEKCSTIGTAINSIFNNRQIIDILQDIFDNRNKPEYYCSIGEARFLKSHFNRNIDTIGNINNIKEYLFQQLKSFESDFSIYLDDATKNNVQFTNNSSDLFRRIIGDEETSYLLTFNYTQLPIDVSNFYLEEPAISVHGTLKNKNIIIGIDSNEILHPDDTLIKFTKAWQKLYLNEFQTQLPKPSDISDIIFYGHSLGRQDYSYFHAIFDFYNIYSSKIKLVFCYSPYKHPTKTEEDIKIEYVTNIYNLLEDYVSKSGKEINTKTFISKIQLEQRLIVREINVIYEANEKSK